MAQEKRTALITGSGRNIGRATALHLAQSGYNIVLNGSQDRAACEAVAAQISDLGSESLIEMCNIGDREAVRAMAQSAIDHFGSVDILINNAAVRPEGKFLEIDEEEWDRVMDINLNSALHLARVCLPGMLAKGWGRIIHYTGMNAQQGNPGRPHVSTSKHALWGLTKSFSKEFGPQGVTCNIISPGTFPDTDADLSSPRLQNLLKANPAGRLGRGEDIAAMIDLLVSDQGGFVNGQMLQINGGVMNQF